MQETLNVILSGATGWAGSALAHGIARQGDIQLVGAVGQRSAGRRLGEVIGNDKVDCVVSASPAEALGAARCDVYVEYSKPKAVAAVKANIIQALQAGAHVVVGTSGLTDA